MRALLPAALVCALFPPLAQAEEPAPKPPAPAAGAPAAPKPAPARRAKKAKKKRNLKGPVASYPGFRMLKGGESRVYVEISEKVEISEHKAEGRIAYRLKGVAVPTRTNRLPLDTSFFASPVARVQLVELDDGDVDLVIELRQPSTPKQTLAESEGGFVLQVDFPAPSAAAPNKPKGSERSSS